MSVTGILGSLLERGIRLKADGDRLVVSAPTGAVTDEIASTIRTNKQALLAVLREIADTDDVRFAPPTTQQPEATGTVSLSQERIWTVSQLHPGTVHYSLTDAWWLLGQLDESALERAVQRVCDRHSLMRSRFVAAEGGGVRLDTVEHRVLELVRIDLSDQPPDQSSARTDAVATAKMEELSTVPFDPSTDFLVRTYLLRLGSERSLFYVVTHSIIWDAPSFEILLDEIGKLYTQIVGVSSEALADLAIRYDDYAWWQHERHRSPEIAAALEYWKRELAGDLSPLTLPVDSEPATSADPQGARFNFNVPDSLVEQVFAYCNASGVTPFMVLLAGYVLLLSRYADTDRVVITAAVQGRDSEQLERLIGTFTNHLLFKFEIDESLSFDSLVGGVKNLALDGFAHQQCAVEAVIEKLDVDLGRSCLFQLNYIYRSADSRPRQWGDLKVSAGPSRNAQAIHGDLTFWIDEVDRSMIAGIDYRADMFTQETVGRLVRRLFDVLAQGLARPNSCVREIAMDGQAAAGQPSEVVSVLGQSGAERAVAETDAPHLLRIRELVRRLALRGGDLVLFADSDHHGDMATWVTEAARLGATVIGPSAVSLVDEWDLYREVRDRQPRVLVSTVPLASALAALDAKTGSLRTVTLLVEPVHADRAVLGSLGQSFNEVHYTLHAEPFVGPVLIGIDNASDPVLYLEPLTQVSTRVLDRLGRCCPAGIDGNVQVMADPVSEGDGWGEAGFRGRFMDDGRIRISLWQDSAALRGQIAGVEQCLVGMPGIEDYHVELRRENTGEGRLLVWVVQSFGQEQTSTERREALRGALAGFRYPILVLDVGSIPRRADGHVLVARLEDPFADPQVDGFELPSPGTEAILAEIWSEILGIERIGAHDSFAELGGSSLQALRVIQRMDARLGWRVEPRLLFFQSLRRVAGRAPAQINRLGQAA